MIRTQFKLSTFAFILGVKALTKKFMHIRVLELLFIPMNYWRAIETPMILDHLNPKKGELILDIGSPKLLSFFICKNNGANVITSDINKYFMNYCDRFANILNVKDRYTTKLVDATDIPLDDESIDKIYALSVFEHIPGDGDIKAVKEAQRVLKKGGILILTLPYSEKYYVDYRNPDFYYAEDINKKTMDKVFYQRNYDEMTLKLRIIGSSGMEVKSIFYIGQRVSLPSSFPFRYLSYFNIALSKLNHTKPVSNPNMVKNPSMVHIVLVKE